MIAKIKSLPTGESGVAMLVVVGFMGLSVPLLLGALALGGGLNADSRVKLEIAKKQYANIAALEYVRYLTDSPENWNQWIDETEGLETLTIGGDTIVIDADGNGVSDYGFLDYCVFGENEVEIEEGSTIQCSIGSNGDVEIEEESTITGNIVSGGNVTLEENVTVNGDVTAVGTVTLEEGAVVMGTTVEGASLDPITGPIPNYDVTITITGEDGNGTTETLSVDGAPLPLTFTLTAGETNIYINPGETDTLVPGSYGTLQVGEDATLNLSSGYYAFDEVSIDENVTINLFVVNGNSIVIDVVGELEYDEKRHYVGVWGDCGRHRSPVAG